MSNPETFLAQCVTLPTFAKMHGRAHQWAYDMVELGYNYRLSDVACALGASQLARLDENLARRRARVATYDRELADLEAVRRPETPRRGESAWHLYPIRLDLARIRVDRDTFLRALRAEGIGATVHYPPVHLLRYYRESLGHAPGECPHAERAAAELLSLPLFPTLSPEDQCDVVTAVRKVCAHYGAG